MKVHSINHTLKVDLYRSMLNWRYPVLIIGMTLVLLLSIAPEMGMAVYHKMPRKIYSSLEQLDYVLVFDRLKPVMVILLSMIYTSSTAGDLSTRYFRFFIVRCGLKEYVFSKLIANAVAITAAVISSFFLFLLALSPIMGLRGAYFSGTSGLREVSLMYPAAVYVILEGILFSSFIVLLSSVGIWASIIRPNRYVAVGIPFVLFYVLYLLTSLLPLQVNMWYLSSGIISLPESVPFLLKYLYGLSFFVVPTSAVWTGCCHEMKKRWENASF